MLIFTSLYFMLSTKVRTSKDLGMRLSNVSKFSFSAGTQDTDKVR